MTCPPEARPLVVLLLAAMKELSLKEIGRPIGMEGKLVSYHLSKESLSPRSSSSCSSGESRPLPGTWPGS